MFICLSLWADVWFKVVFGECVQLLMKFICQCQCTVVCFLGYVGWMCTVSSNVPLSAPACDTGCVGWIRTVISDLQLSVHVCCCLIIMLCLGEYVQVFVMFICQWIHTPLTHSLCSLSMHSYEWCSFVSGYIHLWHTACVRTGYTVITDIHLSITVCICLISR